MQLPFFFAGHIPEAGNELVLDEENSKHIVAVLRMSQGEQLHLTNGRGSLATATIINDHKKKCEVGIDSVQQIEKDQVRVAIAVSLVKNNNRFEWLLEKATEMGIEQIIPLICHRTEKQHFRIERMRGILVSAMLQSRQCWLPQLDEPVRFNDLISAAGNYQLKLIAHCDEQYRQPITEIAKDFSSALLCIGPEGDFTKEEISVALQQGYQPVMLGNTRLRTETAAMVGAAILKIS